MAMTLYQVRRTRSWISKGLNQNDGQSLDRGKGPCESLTDTFQLLCQLQRADLGLLTVHLNSMNRLLRQNTLESLGFTTDEFLICISTSMVDPHLQIRAGALRAVRYILKTKADLMTFNRLQLFNMICRSLEILLGNEEERVQALKLIRRMLAIAPAIIHQSLVRCLVSLTERLIEERDRLLRTCLAILCEFSVLNPMLLICCGGVSAITRNILECHSPRIAESLCGVLLHLLEWPVTRNYAGIHLECLAAPYCDFNYRHGIMDRNKDARDLRFTCSRLALLSILRSYGGVLEFCDPTNVSGLRAIVDVLYLNQLEVRRAILDFLYELLWIPQPPWTDDYSVAFQVVDPADYQDSWRLGEGFVATEGRNILPSLANRVPNICEIHTAFLLYCFLETGLLNALIEVVISSDTFISVRATVLLGKLLQLMYIHLPADLCSTSQALPKLVSYATQGNHQASAALLALQNFHQVLKNRPAPCSLFLDAIIRNGNIGQSKLFKREIDPTDKMFDTSDTAGSSTLDRLRRRRLDSIGSSTSTSGNDEPQSSTSTMGRQQFLHRSGSFRMSIPRIIVQMKQSAKLQSSFVLQNDDGMAWDWDIIIDILRANVITMRMDEKQTKFVRRLVHFYKPSSNRFSHMELGNGRTMPSYVRAGSELIDFLHRHDDLECMRLLTDLFADIYTELLAITSSRSAHDCLFSPQHMSSTMCQQYFLYIGRLCRSSKGVSILKNTDVFKQLIILVTTTVHVCYLKLIVSGLDYTTQAYPIEILQRALTAAPSDQVTGRLYATQFMLVLLRSKLSNFEVWGLPLLIQQTKDKDRAVVLCALDIIDEACHDRPYLEEIVSIWPEFHELGDEGRLVQTRFYSIPRGLNHTSQQTRNEITYWDTVYNKRYVLLIEANTHATLTLHTRNEDGTYSLRNTYNSQATVNSPNILPHLYGQLSQTSQGLRYLQEFARLTELIDVLNDSKMDNEEDCLELKAAMWAIGHVATSTEGVQLLMKTPYVFEKLLFLNKCDVYSVRATALHVLGLIGSTKSGADILYKYDWLCVRHDRDTMWPVYEPEDWLAQMSIRHSYGEMQPYNYTGFEESLNGILETSSSNMEPFDFDESYNKDEVDGEMELNVPIVTKSRTLPTEPTHRKHVRSLSESKTMDGLTQPWGRMRNNSGTDSNTSGVSSCESVHVRIINDLHQTLSPIPSLSNLQDITKRSSERYRRISITGPSFPDTHPSPQDIDGVTEYRRIRRHPRPMVSESAADELREIIYGSGEKKSRRSSLVSKLSSERYGKVRSLDRTTILSDLDPILNTPESGSIPKPLSSSSLAVLDVRGPSYLGICLPKNILELFVRKRITMSTYISHQINLKDYGQTDDSDPQFDAYFDDDDDEDRSMSSLSDASSRRTTKTYPIHNRVQCLQCCRLRSHKIQSPVLSTSTQMPQTFLSGLRLDDTVEGKVNLDILRHVHRLANPIWGKQSKMALLNLKQKQPNAFQNICLYSEVCRTVHQTTYRLFARRFLQELFLDLKFDQFKQHTMDIVARKLDITSPNLISTGSTSIRIGGDPPPTIKSHLKSPPLASVYETSIENLSDSYSQQFTLDSPVDEQTRMFETGKPTIILRTESVDVPTSTSSVRTHRPYRPRFHTLELDLSCTKNKFPIKHMRNDQSPTTPPTTSSTASSSSQIATNRHSLLGLPGDFQPLQLSTSAQTSTGSLYCEKRLQSSQSEASLSKTSSWEKKK